MAILRSKLIYLLLYHKPSNKCPFLYPPIIVLKFINLCVYRHTINQRLIIGSRMSPKPVNDGHAGWHESDLITRKVQNGSGRLAWLYFISVPSVLMFSIHNPELRPPYFLIWRT